MKSTSALRSTTLLVVASLALAGCKSGGPDLPDGPDAPKNPADEFENVGSNPIEGLPEHLSTFFVESFDMAAVRAIRKAARFAAMRVSAPASHDGSARGESNAYEAARIDYAHSVGLTGKNQVISIIDSAIRGTHTEFSGKQITVSEGSQFDTSRENESSYFHGTAVAAIAAGRGDGGEITGVAPDAALHSGALDFEGGIYYSTLARYADEARDLGAIAINNSWGFTDNDGNPKKASDHDLPTFFHEDGDVGSYISALKSFASGNGQDATGGVIVWSASNEYDLDSINVMNALPLAHPDLESNWLAVINVFPEYDEQRIISGTRISQACLEAARYCLGAQGAVMTAYHGDDQSYAYANGTSFAAPQVSGALALLAEAFPNLKASELRDRLLVTADNGWFEHHNEMEFAPGLTHGYSMEFGHGFMDVRAALLPIGDMVFTTGSGETMTVGRPAVSGGAFTGDAVSTSLAKADLLATDGMAGDFALNGRSVTATSRPSSDPERSLVRLASIDLDHTRQTMREAIGSDSARTLQIAGTASGLNAVEALGGQAVPLLDGHDDFRVDAIVPVTSSGAYGVGLHKRFETGAGAFGVTLTSLSQKDSMLGVVAPGHEASMKSASQGVELSYAAALSSDTSLRLSGEFGMASGPGAGATDGFDDVRYDSFGVSLDRRDIGTHGSALSLFARQPMAISDGDAEMTFGTGRSRDGAITYSSMDVDLAPSARQTDIGFEYLAPVGKQANMSFGLTQTLNAGNHSGTHETSASFGFQVRM
jgi:subtilase-type serine protease